MTMANNAVLPYLVSILANRWQHYFIIPPQASQCTEDMAGYMPGAWRDIEGLPTLPGTQ